METGKGRLMLTVEADCGGRLAGIGHVVMTTPAGEVIEVGVDVVRRSRSGRGEARLWIRAPRAVQIARTDAKDQTGRAAA